MPDPTILATWISAVSIGVAALTGLVNLVVTVTLALSVQGFSRRVTETQILQRANGQWQEINKLLLEQPDLQILVDPHFAGAQRDEVRRYNFFFFVIGIVQELFLARERKLVDPRIADPLLEGQLRFLAGNAALVEQIINLDRGYDDSFKEFIKAGLRRGATPAGSSPN